MARPEALDEDGLQPPPARGRTRERLKALIAQRYSPRLHMSLILAACGFTSMLASWSLLHAGVHSMLLRYPVALCASYAVFLLGVWVWLQATGLAAASTEGMALASSKKKRKGNIGLDVDIPSGGGGGGGSGGGGGGFGGIARGGGSFDGGGANASWAPSGQSNLVATNARSGSSGGGGFGLDLDGDALVLIVLAAALVALIAICSGYLIWTAPDVLAEAAFGAALTGTLTRPAAEGRATGWVAGVVKKTWWPFALVLVAAIAFAGWSAAKYPQAATFKQAITAAVRSL